MADPTNPILLFGEWLAEAEKSEPNDPNAMALATVGADGTPSLRMVLMKAYDADGFVFYTNLESRKGEALAAHPVAALLFHWKSLRRQVRIEGPVSPVSADEADAYYASRDHLSKIGAHASRQSRPMDGRAELLGRVAHFEKEFFGRTVPRPDHWSGFRVAPHRIEFWQDKPFRLHERREFTPDGAGWNERLLYP